MIADAVAREFWQAGQFDAPLAALAAAAQSGAARAPRSALEISGVAVLPYSDRGWGASTGGHVTRPNAPGRRAVHRLPSRAC